MVAEEDATTNTDTAASDVPTPPVEQSLFILESDSIDYAKSCDAAKGCLCNVNDG